MTLLNSIIYKLFLSFFCFTSINLLFLELFLINKPIWQVIMSSLLYVLLISVCCIICEYLFFDVQHIFVSFVRLPFYILLSLIGYLITMITYYFYYINNTVFIKYYTQ